jgi:hypothetical protein
MASDEEDDYLSMVIAEPTSRAKESSIQRAARLKKEVGKLFNHNSRASTLTAHALG